MRAGAGKVEERWDGGGEAYTVEMSEVRVHVYILFFFLSTTNDAFYDPELLHQAKVVRRHDGDIIDLDTHYLARSQRGTSLDLSFQSILKAR